MRNWNAAGLLLLCALHAACSTDSTTSPTSKSQYTVKFGASNVGLDVSACSVTIPGGLCNLVLNVDSSGAFHEVWAPGTSNLLQTDGTLTPNTVAATLKCVATTANGVMSATLNGSDYTGTATLSGKTVAIRIVKGSSPGCP